MKDGYHKIFTGLFLTAFHINIGAIPILPAFVGWLYLCSSTRILMQEGRNPAFTKAHSYAVITTIISILMQLANWSGSNMPLLPYISIGYCAFVLLYISQLLEGSAIYLAQYREEAEVIWCRKTQAIFTVFYTINTILISIAIATGDKVLSGGTSIFGIILLIWMLIIISHLKNIEIKDMEAQI